MSKTERKVLGEINGVKIVESLPGDHGFSHMEDGDRPGESKAVCSCGWRSASGMGIALDLDIHFAELNGISYDEQKERTAATMRRLGPSGPAPVPTN